MKLNPKTPHEGVDSALSLSVSLMLHVGLVTVGLTMATQQLALREAEAAAAIIDFDIEVGDFATDPLTEDLVVPETAEIEDEPPPEDVALVAEDETEEEPDMFEADPAETSKTSDTSDPAGPDDAEDHGTAPVKEQE